jgi:hypothetical protein
MTDEMEANDVIQLAAENRGDIAELGCDGYTPFVHTIYVAPRRMYLAIPQDPDPEPEPGPEIPPLGGGGSGCIGVELAELNLASIAILRSAVENRITNVKGNGNDPLVPNVGRRVHRGEVNGPGYHSKVYGIVGGIDHTSKARNSEQCDDGEDHYWRMGIVLGYMKGATEIFGPAAIKKSSVKQDLYAGALFVAGEEFSENNLKTNVNLFAGAKYSKNELSRTDENDNAFGANARGNNWFRYFEFLKIYTAVAIGNLVRGDVETVTAFPTMNIQRTVCLEILAKHKRSQVLISIFGYHYRHQY